MASPSWKAPKEFTPDSLVQEGENPKRLKARYVGSLNVSGRQNPSGGLVKTDFWGPSQSFGFSRSGGGAQEYAFLARSPGMLMPLVQEPYFENHWAGIKGVDLLLENRNQSPGVLCSN